MPPFVQMSWIRRHLNATESSRTHTIYFVCECSRHTQSVWLGPQIARKSPWAEKKTLCCLVVFFFFSCALVSCCCCCGCFNSVADNFTKISKKNLADGQSMILLRLASRWLVSVPLISIGDVNVKISSWVGPVLGAAETHNLYGTRYVCVWTRLVGTHVYALCHKTLCLFTHTQNFGSRSRFNEIFFFE